MAANFALIDQAALAAVDNFDRVFQRDDMHRPFAVELIEQRRQGAGLAAAGWPAHQNQAIGTLRNS
ncbi:hypothetical protein D3C80_1550530 [compost metagenome]